ncbi:MAG: IS630 family transposase [Elusimicrobia bacterium CG1_02_63_36]|nr:MAG: IS630 family transposase [Elusimicrobia bacterium CG1_02_63_36]PJA16382.1 MAG: IS630 family transposase [Elusimicrobia bacterium CG_4_10_14_0_2_um_filter_63_34]
MRTAPPILLSPKERSILSSWAHGRSFPQRLVQRAQIITLAAEKVPNQDIARELGISRPTVQLWRERFLALRVAGLEKDAPRAGRIPNISARKVRAIIEATQHAKPPAATHWSVRTMAEAQGISPASVQRIWKQHGLKPHLIKTFKVSRDKHFVDKLYDVVGLYLNPPDKSLVLCVDEKSQIQALDRTQPGLPMKKGRCGTMTHDYKRNGTTTLFAALSMLDGKVIGDCMPRHRHQEFIRFLKKIDAETSPELNLHLIVDNYATHKHPRVKSWMRRHPRFHLHFIPTSSSWLNMVERWFREITDKRIRRGVFRSVPELIAAIEEYLQNHNQNPRVFTWTATPGRIMAKVAKSKEVLETLH